MVDILVPILLADAICKDHPVDELLMRVADGHEGIDLIIPRHKYFPHLRKTHVEALIFELALQPVPFLC